MRSGFSSQLSIFNFLTERNPIMRRLAFLIVTIASTTCALAEPRTDKIIILGNPSGTQTVQVDPDGTTHAEYSFNDRGRGDHIVATWKLDPAGVPTEYRGSGNDYMKAPVEEHFEIKQGKA